MKTLLLLIMAFLMFNIALAQDASEWATEQRCVPEPSEAPEGWTYDGVIFSFKPRDGVHARRADISTSYYVAFDSDSSFAVSGSLSPDGKWLAVPIGYTQYGRRTGGNDYAVTEIRAYSTDPAQEQVHIPLNRTANGGSAGLAVASAVWLDAQRFAVFGTPGQGGQTGMYSLNPFDQSIEAVTLPELSSLVSVSPDGARWVYIQHVGLTDSEARVAAPGQFDTSTALPIALSSPAPNVVPRIEWAADSSRFVALLSGGGIGVFDRDGTLLDTVPSGDSTRFSLSRDGLQLAYETRGGTIQIADLMGRPIVDTCIAPAYEAEGGLAFSPDGRELAYTMPQLGWVYILDLQAWQAYRIDLAAAEVVGWYPLG